MRRAKLEIAPSSTAPIQTDPWNLRQWEIIGIALSLFAFVKGLKARIAILYRLYL